MTSTPRYSSYLSPKCEARPIFGDDHQGIFALEPIHAGELVAVFGGEVMTYEQMMTYPPEIVRQSIQVEEGLYLVSTYPSPGDKFNHSCDPNAWIEGHIAIVARRDIAVGEHICFDYATCDGSPYDEFTCLCGAASCRGKITGDDWRNPELQARYKGHFMPYLQRRIDGQR